jgi:peroxiredoxin
MAILVASPFAADVEPLEIGAKAPKFNLPGVDGKNYRLSDFDDKQILTIIFTCNHCPTAQAYEERIKQLYRDYHDKGVAIVLISPNDPKAVRLDELGYSDVGDSFEDMKIRAKDQNFPFPYLYDGDKQEVSKAYGPQTTPHVFIFDENRRLRFRGRIDDQERIHKGPPESQDTRAALDALLAGEPVPVKTTRTYGCSIKWADKRGSVKEAFDRWAQEPVSLKSINAEEVEKMVSSNEDDYLLINLWATWCGPCVEEFPEFVTINRMYRKRPFQMISINTDAPDNRDKVLNFLKENEASFTNYQYKGNVYDLFDALDPKASGAIPFTVFISPEGDIIYRKNGPIDPLHLKKVIVDNIGRYYQ